MIKKTLITIANLLGFDVYKKPGKFYSYFLTLLQNNKIDCILDVGANTGQYAQKLRKYGFNGEIHSFEPIQSTFEILKKNSLNDEHWFVYNVAVGAKNGKEIIHVSENTESSSILDINSSNQISKELTKYVNTEEIEIIRLDKLINELASKKKKLFLKVDTQGYEMEVLKGIDNIEENIVGLQLELSLTQLYESELLYDEIIYYLKKKKYELYQIETGTVDIKSGRLLQFDGIFIRE